MQLEKLIYAILSQDKNAGRLTSLLSGIKGMSGASLEEVCLDDITVVTSDVNKADIVVSKSTALDFARVIETLSQQYTLLPMRFGSVMESAGAIKKMVERNRAEIVQNLRNVEGRYEFGLKIFCDSEKLMAELKEKAGNTITLHAPEPNVSVFRDYVNRKLSEHRLEEMLVHYVDAIIAEITGTLTGLNAVQKIKKMVSPAMIIDAVFLIEASLKDELVSSIAGLQEKYPSLNLMMTGPWPPYNFVDFTVK